MLQISFEAFQSYYTDIQWLTRPSMFSITGLIQSYMEDRHLRLEDRHLNFTAILNMNVLLSLTSFILLACLNWYNRRVYLGYDLITVSSCTALCIVFKVSMTKLGEFSNMYESRFDLYQQRPISQCAESHTQRMAQNVW